MFPHCDFDGMQIGGCQEANSHVHVDDCRDERMLYMYVVRLWRDEASWILDGHSAKNLHPLQASST